jgi:hypothetical protein
MGKSIRVKLNRNAVRAIAKSPEMQAIIEGVVNNIAAKANANGETDGFEARVRVGKTRARGSVVSVSNEARRAEATDRALSKAITAGD